MAAWALAVALICGCSSSDETTTSPTFHRDIEPIVQRRCQDCHLGGGVAPMSLVTYAEVAAVSQLVVTETQARRMPPWGALETDECKPRNGYRDDLHLSQYELATLAAWHAAGAPEGDPDDAPPPRAPLPTSLADPSIELAAREPFAVESGSDRFRCLVLDPEVSEDRWIDGFHLVPGAREVVHHALLYEDPTRASLAHAAVGDGYDCFGGPNLSGETRLLAGWAVGTQPIETEPGVAIRLSAGSLLVLQIHYHPHGESTLDASRLQLRFASSAPDHRLEMLLLGNFDTAAEGLEPGPNDDHGVEFNIVAGAAGHSETMHVTIPALPVPEVRVYGVAHHLHYLGTDMKTEIVRGEATAEEPERECLLQTPQWDYRWQRFYRYAAPLEALPPLRAGDQLRFRCTYDNTLDNPRVRQALGEQGLTAPVDVHLGETTLDEMCITAVAVVTP